jgi:hypothetical protein
MPIIKIKKRTHPYTMIDSRALNDRRLSWKAKGIMAYLLSKPTDWQVRFTDVVAHAPDGPTSVRSGLNELRRYGYATLTAKVDINRKLAGSVWTIYEWPDASPEMQVFRISGEHGTRDTSTSVNVDARPVSVFRETPITNNDTSTNKDGLLLRLCRLFDRQDVTLLPRELKAWRSISGQIACSEVSLVERFHRSRRNAQKPPFPRQELATLLENFYGELDKARRILKVSSQKSSNCPAGQLSSIDNHRSPMSDDERASIVAHGRHEVEELREKLKAPSLALE